MTENEASRWVTPAKRNSYRTTQVRPLGNDLRRGPKLLQKVSKS